MASKFAEQLTQARDVLFPRRCERKVRYAMIEAVEGARRARSATTGTPLYAYLCPICQGWHMTKLAQVSAKDFE